MATCEGVTALVTLMLAIWSKIRVLESKFVTKRGPTWSRGRVGMAEALGGWSVDGWGFESKKGIGADGDKMKEAEGQMPPNGGAQQPVSGKRHKSFLGEQLRPDSGST